MKNIEIEKRISKLMQHRSFSRVLSDIPHDVRHDIVCCLLFSKKEFPLPMKRENMAFTQLASITQRYFESIIDEVSESLIDFPQKTTEL